jgi:hypothetical protein
MTPGKLLGDAFFHDCDPRCINYRNSVNCRLPHTPRTPTVGMAHYFDDVFHRYKEAGTPRPMSMPRMRRSSTARSMSIRSDFETSTNENDDDHGPLSGSVALEDTSKIREKREADAHMHRYITDQLERYRDDNNLEEQDELETTP